MFMRLLVSKVIISFLLIGMPVVAPAQDFSDTNTAPREEKNFWSWDKVMVGGSGGAQFGDFVAINVTPSIGYRITDRFHAGTRIPFQYVNDKIFYYEYFIYGASLFGRYFVWDNLFLHLEPEALKGPWEFGQDPFFIYNVWAGGGYMFPIGQNSGAYLSLLFNVTGSPYTRYRNPNLQAGFMVGL